MINRDRLINLTKQLININSENPPGSEKKIAGFVKKFLSNLGLKVELLEFKKNRTNVIGRLAGRPAKDKPLPTLLLTVHLDTVPAGKGWKFPPFKATVNKNKIYGRGAADCKGNTAVLLAAIESIVKDKIKLNYNLIFLATSDEEVGSHYGIIPVLAKNKVKASAAIILDAHNFEVVTAQKGLLQFKIKISGRKAHGAYPEKGINAIELAAFIIKDLKDFKFKYKKHAFLKPPTVNIGTIEGGDKVNIVADWCVFSVDMRFLPDMKVKDILFDVKRVISKFADKFKIEILDIQPSYEIDKNNYLVKNLLLSLKNNKIIPKIAGSEGATVVTFFEKKNIEAIATGFSNPGTMHITNEYIKIENLYKGALVLEDFLKNFKFDNEKR